jgi:nicotinic acid mononucleotide adenylyltransferase
LNFFLVTDNHNLSPRTSAEDKQALRVGTADLLDMILEKDPSIEVTLALGVDTFMDLTTWKWRRAKYIIRILKGRIIVFQRKVEDDSDSNSSTCSCTVVTEEELQKRIDDISTEMKEDCPNLKRTIIIEKVSCLTPVSSSLARTSLNENYLQSEICEGVLEFMKQKELYQFASDKE